MTTLQTVSVACGMDIRRMFRIAKREPELDQLLLRFNLTQGVGRRLDLLMTLSQLCEDVDKSSGTLRRYLDCYSQAPRPFWFGDGSLSVYGLCYTWTEQAERHKTMLVDYVLESQTNRTLLKQHVPGYLAVLLDAGHPYAVTVDDQVTYSEGFDLGSS